MSSLATHGAGAAEICPPSCAQDMYEALSKCPGSGLGVSEGKTRRSPRLVCVGQHTCVTSTVLISALSAVKGFLLEITCFYFTRLLPSVVFNSKHWLAGRKQAGSGILHPSPSKLASLLLFQTIFPAWFVTSHLGTPHLQSFQSHTEPVTQSWGLNDMETLS